MWAKSCFDLSGCRTASFMAENDAESYPLHKSNCTTKPGSLKLCKATDQAPGIHPRGPGVSGPARPGPGPVPARPGARGPEPRLRRPAPPALRRRVHPAWSPLPESRPSHARQWRVTEFGHGAQGGRRALSAPAAPVRDRLAGPYRGRTPHPKLATRSIPRPAPGPGPGP